MTSHRRGLLSSPIAPLILALASLGCGDTSTGQGGSGAAAAPGGTGGDGGGAGAHGTPPLGGSSGSAGSGGAGGFVPGRDVAIPCTWSVRGAGLFFEGVCATPDVVGSVFIETPNPNDDGTLPPNDSYLYGEIRTVVQFDVRALPKVPQTITEESLAFVDGAMSNPFFKLDVIVTPEECLDVINGPAGLRESIESDCGPRSGAVRRLGFLRFTCANFEIDPTHESTSPTSSPYQAVITDVDVPAWDPDNEPALTRRAARGHIEGRCFGYKNFPESLSDPADFVDISIDF